MNSLKLFNNELTMTLKEITDLLEVRHNDAMKTVERMTKNQDFGTATKISYQYTKGNGAKDAIETYELNERQAIAIASRLNVSLLMKVIDRLKELEQEKIQGRFKLPTNYKEAVANLLEALEEKEILEKQIELDKPKVEAFDNSKVIFPKKESVYDKERGYKKDIQEVYPFLAIDKITLILDYYTKTRFEDTNHYVKEEALEIIEDFFIDADFQISPNKKIVFVKHPCLLNQNLKVKKDKAIKYLGYTEEDF